MDHEVIYGIPAVEWVLVTIAKANARNDASITCWRDAWGETYFNLGGDSQFVARKGCLMKGAYGLWQSGRILKSGMPNQGLSTQEIRSRYGKNAAYAHLALDLLASGNQFGSAHALWIAVREAYRHQVHEEPAVTEQGAARIAKILHETGLAR